MKLIRTKVSGTESSDVKYVPGPLVLTHPLTTAKQQAAYGIVRFCTEGSHVGTQFKTVFLWALLELVLQLEPQEG